jgi:hypothetical protein
MAGALDSGDPQPVADRVAARARLLELVSAYAVSAAVGAVARLEVPDALADGPLSAAEIAARVGADPRALERVLRSLLEAGVFEQLTDGRFALTGLGELLRTDVPESIRPNAVAWTEEWYWRAYGHLTLSAQTGQTGFAAAHGCGLWEYLDAHPDAERVFSGAMAQSAERRAAAFVRGYDLSGIDSLIDVGGGHGALMRAALAAHPQLRGVVFDQPNVLAGAERRLGEAGLLDRCELVAGDFFDAVPRGGDAYTLSWIIHDWGDEDAERILTNVRRAAGDVGRLVVIEGILSDDHASHPVTSLDLTMLVVAGGRERTQVEYRELYHRAGFELSRVLPLEGVPWSVVEGSPA